jgi:phosphate transport system substrate-binding protein
LKESPESTVLKKLLVAACLLLSPLPSFAEIIRIGGTGSASPLMQLLGAAYHALHPDDDVKVMLPPPSSGGGIRMLASGKLDLALSGRPLKADEKPQVGLSFQLASTPLVFVGRGMARENGFTRSEIADLYAGRLTHWKDGSKVSLILRSAYESETTQLRTLSPAVDEAIRLAHERPGMAYAENDLDAVALLSKTPGSFGTSTLGLLKTMNHALQIYPLDGVAPSLQTLGAGKYPLSKPVFLIAGRQPSNSSKRFLEYLRSTAAKDILQRNGYLAAP